MNIFAVITHFGPVRMFFVYLLFGIFFLGGPLIALALFFPRSIAFITNRFVHKINNGLDSYFREIQSSKNLIQLRAAEQKFLKKIGWMLFYPADSKEYVREIKLDIESRMEQMQRGLKRGKKL
jgi:hypothetical protein